MDRPHQRQGATSNAQVGEDFELLVQEFFKSHGVVLNKSYSILIGVDSVKKEHKFDFGNEQRIVECKSHTWTKPNEKMPSAKLTAWNQAMYYFNVVNRICEKILVVQKDYSEKRNKTLAEYYIDTYAPHMIPNDVKIWEFDIDNTTMECLFPKPRHTVSL